MPVPYFPGDPILIVRHYLDDRVSVVLSQVTSCEPLADGWWVETPHGVALTDADGFGDNVAPVEGDLPILFEELGAQFTIRPRATDDLEELWAMPWLPDRER